MSKARAFAHTNIALVKYWGKRQGSLNLPATGSLSMTLDRFGTDTTVELHGGPEDTLVLDGEPASAKETARVSKFLDIIRDVAGRDARCAVTSENHVPTAAGLASSASAFAALALAGSEAFGLSPNERQLSILARRGSGSAARSIFGGFVRMNAGARDDGEDAYAEPLEVKADFSPRLLVVRCAEGRKKVGSTEGMERTRRTSPFYVGWVESHAVDMLAAEEALLAGDLEKLGETMEHSTLKMHASALAARPGLWYLTPTTLAVMNRVRELRSEGTLCFFTMDAGPHVKVLCSADDAESLAQTLGVVPGTHGVSIAAPGIAAHRVAER